MDKKHMAKKEALKKLKAIMSDLSGGSLMDGLKGGMSAKVVAKDPKSLKKGLEKAEDIVEEKMLKGDEEQYDMEEEHDMEDEYSNMSKEELIKMIKSKM